MDAFRINDYASICWHFAWGDFCDWFLEFAKPAFASDDAAEAKDVAGYVLGILLRLLHPVMPYVTESLWDHFGYGEAGSLILSAWPEAMAVRDPEPARAELSWVKKLVSEIRTVRSEMNVPPSNKSPVLLKDAAPETLARAERWKEAIFRMARASEIGELHGEVPKGIGTGRAERGRR